MRDTDPASDGHIHRSGVEEHDDLADIAVDIATQERMPHDHSNEWCDRCMGRGGRIYTRRIARAMSRLTG